MLRNFLAIGLTATLVTACCIVWAQDVPPKLPEVPAESQGEEDPFKVPEGTDSEAIMLFLQRLASTPPVDRSLPGIRAHLNKMDGALEQILTRKIDDTLFLNVAQMRFQLLNTLPQFGDEQAKAKLDAFTKSLKNDTRPQIKTMVAEMEIIGRVENVAEVPEAEQIKLMEELANLIKDAPKDDMEKLGFALSAAMQAAGTLEDTDSKATVNAYRLLIAALKGRSEEQLARLTPRLEGTLRRVELPGNSIEVSGTTVDGKPFDIKQYEGKVVLVDFWATWCGPCRAELPNVKEMYAAYHDKGFEVVGISLDNDKAELKTFLEAEKIPWVTLYDDKAEDGWDNKIAVHYGISGIPAVILVNQQGKVINLNARGEELQRQLAMLLGPIEKKAEEAPAAKLE